ncbi:AEC family transporter [Salinisphaera sp. Q1T1-3]|uniref:AEC family transporter n=1 Tax=Salinisphaera sp. Q1T1-3 TaxID=2321229 RepID=UPI000E72EBF5|nr:AEC family transporter [Salinisphaera sp. Q1T1-3]RJS91357.1 AEC family transporter [Salinisphaera sp. Q1T1-3]
MLLRILEIIVPVFGVIGLGYLYGRTRRIDVRDANALNITIFTPALIFYALTERAGGQLSLGLAAVAALVVVFGAGALGWLWVRATGRRADVYLPPLMFPNCGNLGLPVAHLAFGNQGLALMVVLMVVENTLQFTVGLWLLGERMSPRRLASNPMILATVAGLACMAFDWHAPAMIAPAIKMLGEVSIPLMLIALGVRLSAGAKGQWRAGLIGGLAAPIVGLAVAIPFVALTRPDAPLAALVIIFGVMPPAVLNYMLAEQYDVDPEQVAAIVAVGHVVALASIPLTLAFVL